MYGVLLTSRAACNRARRRHLLGHRGHGRPGLLLEPLRRPLLPGENSVTIWFNESPITPEEREMFAMSVYPSSYHHGRERTMFVVAFCPGGGSTTASPEAVTKL